jgi:hypothetical protein
MYDSQDNVRRPLPRWWFAKERPKKTCMIARITSVGLFLAGGLQKKTEKNIYGSQDNVRRPLPR